MLILRFLIQDDGVFQVANVLDLVYGLIFYREQLGFLTTYFHHTIYTWLMVFWQSKEIPCGGWL